MRQKRSPRSLILLAILALVLIWLAFFFTPPEGPTQDLPTSTEEVDLRKYPPDSIHPSGLAYAPGFGIVRGNCTTCHSAKLITQNRATREGWKQMIVWMQETQNLHDLEEDEPIILDYLAKHYAPAEVGRRGNLDVEEIEWYIHELE
jgi:hypothetical protein